MGGGNAQKSAAARLKNQQKMGQNKTPEQIAAAKAKEAADKNAFQCIKCMQCFAANATRAILEKHREAKHDKDPLEACFTAANIASCRPSAAEKKAARDNNKQATKAAAGRAGEPKAAAPKKKKDKKKDDLSTMFAAEAAPKKKSNKGGF